MRRILWLSLCLCLIAGLVHPRTAAAQETGNLNNIALDDPTLDRWINIDAGFERDPAKIPAAFEKHAFPFRIDDVRGMPLSTTF